jgi:hypothetical protein
MQAARGGEVGFRRPLPVRGKGDSGRDLAERDLKGIDMKGGAHERENRKSKRTQEWVNREHSGCDGWSAQF